jgi:hypothetical protein
MSRENRKKQLEDLKEFLDWVEDTRTKYNSGEYNDFGRLNLVGAVGESLIARKNGLLELLQELNSSEVERVKDIAASKQIFKRGQKVRILVDVFQFDDRSQRVASKNGTGVVVEFPYTGNDSHVLVSIDNGDRYQDYPFRIDEVELINDDAEM